MLAAYASSKIVVAHAVVAYIKNTCSHCEQVISHRSIAARRKWMDPKFAGANYRGTNAALKHTREAVACATLHQIGTSRPNS
jgi:hypothetical protein